MGICLTTPEQREAKKRTKLLDTQNYQQFISEQKKIKLLLLGAGESGYLLFLLNVGIYVDYF